MTSYNQDGKVGPWAREKLQCLQKYLSAYTTILKNQKFDGYFYIDAFAGGGRAEMRRSASNMLSKKDAILPGLNLADEPEVSEYIDGSPRVALSIEPPFTRYVFIEQDQARANDLDKLKDEFPDRAISVYAESAEHVLSQNILKSGLDWRRYRGVIFLDPFGLQVKWDLIRRIAETKSLEVFINFPVGMAIQRKLTRDPSKLASHDIHMLNKYFGDEDWFDVVYSRNPDLVTGQYVMKNRDSGRALADWYQNRLTEVFGYGAQPRLVRNPGGSHLYYLLFASPNRTGAKIADYVLKQGSDPDKLF